MVEQSPGDGTTRRLTGGAIASLSGVGVLVIFMIQNTDDVKLDFLFWSFTWSAGPSRLVWRDTPVRLAAPRPPCRPWLRRRGAISVDRGAGHRVVRGGRAAPTRAHATAACNERCPYRRSRISGRAAPRRARRGALRHVHHRCGDPRQSSRVDSELRSKLASLLRRVHNRRLGRPLPVPKGGVAGLTPA